MSMQVAKNGSKLVLTIDLDPNPQPSKSGKSLILFSSGGFAEIESGVKVNITVIKGR